MPSIPFMTNHAPPGGEFGHGGLDGKKAMKGRMLGKQTVSTTTARV